MRAGTLCSVFLLFGKVRGWDKTGTTAVEHRCRDHNRLTVSELQPGHFVLLPRTICPGTKGQDNPPSLEGGVPPVCPTWRKKGKEGRR